MLRHRMGYDGANRATLAAAFRRLRARAARQRRAREYVAVAAARREAVLVRSAFDALARGSRARAAAAAAAAARCRGGLAAWRRATSAARGVRALCWRRQRATAVRGLRRWRQRSVDGRGGGGGFGYGADGREALEWRLEVFRERRAKRLVFLAWRSAAQTAAAVAVLEGGAGGGLDGSGGGRGRGEGRRRHRDSSRLAVTGRDELTACPRWGARLRTAEVKGGRPCLWCNVGVGVEMMVAASGNAHLFSWPFFFAVALLVRRGVLTIYAVFWCVQSCVYLLYHAIGAEGISYHTTMSPTPARKQQQKNQRNTIVLSSTPWPPLKAVASTRDGSSLS